MMPHSSHLPAVDIPSCNLLEFVLGRSHEFGDRIALLEDWSGRQVSYSNLRNSVAQVADGLHNLGFGRGSVLCLYASNCVENVSLLFGALATGGAVHLMMPLAPTHLVAPQVVHCEAEFLAITGDREERVVSMLNSVESRVRRLIVIEDGEERTCPHFPHQRIAFSSLLGPQWKWERVMETAKPDDLAVLQLTGGTTGMAKTIMTRHRNLVASQAQAEPLLAPTSNETFLGFLPINHSFPINAVFCPALRHGGRIVVMRGFDPDAVVTNVEKFGATVLHLVPSQIRAMLRTERARGQAMSSLREIMSGALTVHPDLFREVLKRFREGNPEFDFRQAYGMTETSGAITLIPPPSQRSCDKPGSVGVLLSQSQARLLRIPKPGKESSPAEEVSGSDDGELWLRGPQMMQGYFKQPDKTAEVLVDGWLRTGDVAHFDEDEFLFVTDRVADIIWSGDEMILPSFLENILSCHPSLVDFVVLGVKDSTLGHVPAAMVISDTPELTKQDVIDFVDQRLEGSTGLKHVVFVESIKKTPVGKPYRSTLRKEIEQLLS